MYGDKCGWWGWVWLVVVSVVGVMGVVGGSVWGGGCGWWVWLGVVGVVDVAGGGGCGWGWWVWLTRVVNMIVECQFSPKASSINQMQKKITFGWKSQHEKTDKKSFCHQGVTYDMT